MKKVSSLQPEMEILSEVRYKFMRQNGENRIYGSQMFRGETLGTAV